MEAPPPLNISRPARTWPEVLAEYNRRHPEDAYKDERAVRSTAGKAHLKIRQALAGGIR